MKFRSNRIIFRGKKYYTIEKISLKIVSYGHPVWFHQNIKWAVRCQCSITYESLPLAANLRNRQLTLRSDDFSICDHWSL